MAWNDMGTGGVGNTDLYIGAKIQQAYIEVDTGAATAGNGDLVFYHRHQDAIIMDISVVYVGGDPSGLGKIDIGVPTDLDAIVDEWNTDDGLGGGSDAVLNGGSAKSEGDVEQVDLATTLKSTLQEDYGMPVVPKNTPLLIDCDGAGGGSVFVVVTYILKDDDH